MGPLTKPEITPMVMISTESDLPHNPHRLFLVLIIEKIINGRFFRGRLAGSRVSLIRFNANGGGCRCIDIKIIKWASRFEFCVISDGISADKQITEVIGRMGIDHREVDV